MVARPIIHRTIMKRSKEFRDVICIPQWTKHHVGMEDPLEGVPAELNEVFKYAEKVDQCYVHKVFKKIVIKLRNGTWYETPESNLEQLARDRAAVSPTQAQAFNEALRRSEQLRIETQEQSNVIRKETHDPDHEDNPTQDWLAGDYSGQW